MKPPYSFDEIDFAIIEQLRQNGRASNQQIAEMLDLTPVTVATCIKRMEEADQLRAVGVADFSAFGYNALMKIAIEVDNRPAPDVANDLAQIPEIMAVQRMTGRHEIDFLLALLDYS
jgi:Lrp/AsnC family transcriptional regulator for asnA, asnC and gidA